MSEYSDTRNYYGKLLIIAKKLSTGRNFQKALRGSTGTFEGDPYVAFYLLAPDLLQEKCNSMYEFIDGCVQQN